MPNIKLILMKYMYEHDFFMIMKLRPVICNSTGLHILGIITYI